MADVMIYVVIERNPGPVTVENRIQTRKSELPRDSASKQINGQMLLQERTVEVSPHRKYVPLPAAFGST